MKTRDPIERLRSLAAQPSRSSIDCETIHNFIDEIEAAYMRLPVDADGVPIFFGDLLSTIETGETFMCRGLAVCLRNETERFWTVEFDFDDYTGTPEYVSAKSCRHVKPDTVESLLADFQEDTLISQGEYAGEVIEANEWKQELERLVEEYAERIRKAAEHG